MGDSEWGNQVLQRASEPMGSPLDNLQWESSGRPLTPTQMSLQEMEGWMQTCKAAMGLGSRSWEGNV